jgi:branched-chain amino acid transport system ATP-binding protein
MLEVERLTVRYGPVTAVRDVSFTCEPGQVVTILGTNGAGKTSTLTGIAGAAPGAVTGSVRLDGVELLRTSPEERVRRGLALVPERRRILASLTVRENLQVAMSSRPAARGASRRESRLGRQELDAVVARFPVLGDRAASPAGLLSGGQQQQLAIARALLCRPTVLLLDEPSLGLAPQVIDGVFALIAELREEGLGIVLVEQNVHRAVAVADETLMLRQGRLHSEDDTAVADIDKYFGWDTTGSEEAS